jgi:hypothetical protein
MATTPDNRPWAPHPIPSWVIKEFIRRQNDIGFDYPVPVSINWDDNGNWQQYKGPLTAWARVFSNGTGRVNDKSDFPIRNGFILHGGDGFDKSYGIPDNKNVLGYDSEGVEHVLNLSSDGNFVTFPNSLSDENRTVQKFLPVPGITSIDAIIQKERIRKITVNWKCYGFAQLEYMTPYFLTPKISAFVEFGWNHFNPVSLLDLRASNLDNLKELFTNSGSLLYDKNIKESYGLYDVTMGIISGFDFTSQDGITYDCKTEILSKHANYSGVLVNTAAKVSSDTNKSSVQSTFAEYLEKRLTKIPNCILQKKNFMSPLDDEEEKAEKNSTFLSSTFPFYKYNNGTYTAKSNDGKDLKRPEDRFFMGRKIEYGDSARMTGMSDYDWDRKDQKDIWVTMGFVVELANVFFNKQINIQLKDSKDYNLYEIDIDDVKIGAHPNLISCDGSILLIPNKKAPKYNLGAMFPTVDPTNNDYQKQKFGKGANKSLFFSEKLDTPFSSSFDNTLFRIFRTGYQSYNPTYEPTQIQSFYDFTVENSLITKLAGIRSDAQIIEDRSKQPILLQVFRDDLDGIINRFIYDTGVVPGTRSFPQWTNDTETSKPAGYWGYLKDLYVNKNVLIECAKSSETVEVFYNSLLGKINAAAAKIWELAVVEDSEDSGKLRIVDKKYVQYNKMKIYQFDVGASNSFIKTINFTAQLSNVAANQVISSASSNKRSGENYPNGEVNSNQILPFPYGDRFNKDGPLQLRKIDENLESIRQLQNSPQSSTATKGSYIMSFKSYLSRSDGLTTISGPRTTTPLNPNNTVPPSRAAASTPRTTTPLNPNNPAPPSRAAAATNTSGPRTTTPLNPTVSGVETGWNIVNLVLPNDSLLIALMNDMDFKNNTNIYGGQQPGFTVEMTLQGISGLRTFQLFSLKNLPSPYSEREIICQIVDVSHKVEAGNWTTTIKAGIRSIRGQSISFTTDGINEYSINIIK